MQNSERPDNLRELSIQGGAWAALGAAVASGSAFVSFLLLSRLLGPEAYGLMAMVDVCLALGQRLMQNGLSEPLIQLPRLEPEHAHTMFWTLQVFALVLMAVFAAGSGGVAAWFDQPALPPLIVAASVSLYFQAVGLVPRALLARRFEFSKTARAGVSGEIGGGIIGVAAALSGFGVWSLVFQRVAIGLIESMVLWVAARWRPSAVWSRRCFSDVWLFSSSRAFEGLLLFVDQQAPRILLGRVTGAVELGYFVFARRIVENTVTLLNAPIRTTALSAFSAMQSDSARVRRAYAEGVGLTTAVVFPACAGIAMVAPYLVPAMVGETWNPAVVLLQLLVLASIRQSFHIWNGAVLRGLGKPQLLLVASMVRTAVILALIAVLLPWGAIGISIGILAGNYVSWPIAMRYVRRVTGVSVIQQLRPGAGPALAALAMAGVLAVIRYQLDGVLPLYATLVVLILAGAVCYAAALAFLGRKQFSGLLGIVRTLPGVRR